MEKETLLKLIDLMDTDYKKSGHKKSEQYLKAEKMLLKTATAQELLIIMEKGDSFEFDVYFNTFLKRKDGKALVDILEKDIELIDDDISKISKVLIEIGDAKYIYEFIIATPELLQHLVYKDTLPSLITALSKSENTNVLIQAYKNYKIRQFDGLNNNIIFNRILEVASVNTLIKFINDNFENVNFPNNKNTGYLNAKNIESIVDTICDKANPLELGEAVIYMKSRLIEKQKEQLVKEQLRKTDCKEDAIQLAQVYVDIKLKPSLRRDILLKIDELDAKDAKEYILEFSKPEDYERKIIDHKFLTAEQKGIEEILVNLEWNKD